ncbi:MAG TPA: APC family permease [Flavitalea sp.]|nr:APC family permease [Flavitalea sp.]
MKQDQGISLQRGIHRWDLILLFINSVIGAGIFGLPSKIFALSGLYSLLAFVACAVVVMVFVLCFAEVSSQFDKTGGPYLYTLTAFGRLPAFIMGWLFMLSRIFNYATLINLMTEYLPYFSASLGSPGVRVICILLLTALLSYINYLGVRNSARINNILTVSKLLPLTAFIFIGLFNIEPSLFSGGKAFELPSFTASVLFLIFAFGGFESILVNSGEIERPQKNIPFALIVSTVVIAIYYCLIQLVCIGSLPGLATSDRPLAEAAAGFMGPWGGGLIVAGALISITGTLNVLLLSGSRMPYALSLEKQLPPVFTTVHPKYLTPTWSLIAMGAAIAIVSLLWSFITALAVASVIRVLVYLIVCAALIKLRKQNANTSGKAHFKLRYGRPLALTGIGLSFWLLSATKQNEIVSVSVCILAGLVLYFIFARPKAGDKG